MQENKKSNIEINLDNKRPILQSIKAFLETEYETKFSDAESVLQHTMTEMVVIPIAYTTLENDEDLEIQTSLDIQNRKLVKRVTGNNSLVHEEVEFYKNDKSMIAAIEQYTFNELIYLEADSDWLIKVLK